MSMYAHHKYIFSLHFCQDDAHKRLSSRSLVRHLAVSVPKTKSSVARSYKNTNICAFDRSKGGYRYRPRGPPQVDGERKVFKVDPGKYQCYGCGAELQDARSESAGYLDPDTYALKRLHRHLRQTLCCRCQELSNGAMLNAVAGQAHAALNTPGLISPDDLREQLKHLQHQKALVLLVVDVLDFNGSFMARIRDLVGSNPIMLVVTKMDLLPRGTEEGWVLEWVRERAQGRRLTIAGVHMVSSRTGAGMQRTLGAVLSERRGRAVYCLGAANVGKSSFVRGLLAALKQQDLAAGAVARRLPTTSAMPGTTLGLIPIPAFGPRENELFDTAGVLIDHRLNAVLNEDELKLVNPRRRLNTYTPPNFESDSGTLEGVSYLWGAVMRIDVLKAPPTTRLSFIGPPCARVSTIQTSALQDDGECFMPDSTDLEEKDLFGLETVRIRDGLRPTRDIELAAATRGSDPIADVVMSGLGGWIGVFSKAGKAEPNDVILRVWSPKGVGIFIRPAMPIAWNTKLDR